MARSDNDRLVTLKSPKNLAFCKKKGFTFLSALMLEKDSIFSCKKLDNFFSDNDQTSVNMPLVLIEQDVPKELDSPNQTSKMETPCMYLLTSFSFHSPRYKRE